MDMYAVVLYFDEKSSEKLNEGIRKISDVSNNHYMVDVRIPPHITIAAFSCEDPTRLLKKVGDFAGQIMPFSVEFDRTGAFGTRVLFASPIKDEWLKKINEKVHELLLWEFEPADNENYIPQNWIPHCALAVRLAEEQFLAAKEIQMDFPLTARVQRIALAKCNPYKEIESWELEKGSGTNEDKMRLGTQR